MAKTQFSRNPGNINGVECVQKKAWITIKNTEKIDFVCGVAKQVRKYKARNAGSPSHPVRRGQHGEPAEPDPGHG